MLPMISAMRCSLCRMLATSSSGGRWVMSAAPRGFLRSRLQLLAINSATGTFHARSFSSRLLHHA